MIKQKKRETLSKPATKRDLQRLERKLEASFDQLVVTLNAALKLIQKQARHHAQPGRKRA